MIRKIRQALLFLWRTVEKFFADGCPGMAAALSFYVFFSLPALLTMLLMLVGTVADPRDVQQAIVIQAEELMGPGAASQVRTVIEYARGTTVDTSAAALLGIAALLFGATTAFAQLQSALNRAWGVKPDPRRNSIRTFLTKRVFSFGVVLAVAFLLLVSLALTAIVGAIGDRLSAGLGVPEALLRAGNSVLSFAVVTALFALMFKLLPDAVIDWRDVWVGALGTALLFALGKTAIGAYLGSTDPGSAYGAAGSLAVVLIWIYYSSTIVLVGAEFTRVWTARYGHGLTPEPGAVEVVQEERPVERP